MQPLCSTIFSNEHRRYPRSLPPASRSTQKKGIDLVPFLRPSFNRTPVRQTTEFQISAPGVLDQDLRLSDADTRLCKLLRIESVPAQRCPFEHFLPGGSKTDFRQDVPDAPGVGSCERSITLQTSDASCVFVAGLQLRPLAACAGTEMARWIFRSNTCTPKPDKTVNPVIGTGIDITARKRAQKELIEACDGLKLLYDHPEDRVRERTMQIQRRPIRSWRPSLIRYPTTCAPPASYYRLPGSHSHEGLRT